MSIWSVSCESLIICYSRIRAHDSNSGGKNNRRDRCKYREVAERHEKVQFRYCLAGWPVKEKRKKKKKQRKKRRI
ncbi:hypothetical protein PUN28_010556 [Cardiocondyla obscurior]|uniref:Uncharacterized protein n=1 Tax=Cardiocondyla obscurior TaxID=286306 RepID=A0AAW2FLL6_9HYME